mgnify:CR=1 FL=1
MTFPHRFDAHGCCRCGVPVADGRAGSDCPAALRARIAELERDIVAVVAWLRRPCGDPLHDERWCPTCGQLRADADAIEAGKHREDQP